MEEQKSSFIISNVGAGEQGLHLYVRIPNTELRTRQTLPDAEKNVSFLLAAWLLEGEREDRNSPGEKHQGFRRLLPHKADSRAARTTTSPPLFPNLINPPSAWGKGSFIKLDTRASTIGD